jgi:hypothetical protein
MTKEFASTSKYRAGIVLGDNVSGEEVICGKKR